MSMHSQEQSWFQVSSFSQTCCGERGQKERVSGRSEVILSPPPWAVPPPDPCLASLSKARCSIPALPLVCLQQKDRRVKPEFMHELISQMPLLHGQASPRA